MKRRLAVFVFLFLTLAFIAVGAVFAVREDKRAPHKSEDKRAPRESESDDAPRLVISQRVPSVTDTVKRGKH